MPVASKLLPWAPWLLSTACAGPFAGQRELQVTSGALVWQHDATATVEDGAVRAQLRGGASAALLEFMYLGPTAHDAPLASGEHRRQIGLKLRARDTCNVVYVMWHIEPAARIEVSVKHNPGWHTHAECRDHGYAFVSPTWAAAAAKIQPNEWHSLSTRLNGRQLEVLADGRVTWRGVLPEAAFSFDGPVGLRSDNGRFALRFRAE